LNKDLKFTVLSVSIAINVVFESVYIKCHGFP